MSHRRIRRLAIGGALAALSAVALPAAPAQAGIYQIDDFKLGGGTRYTMTVSAPTQVPRLPATSKGYRRVCGVTGPTITARINSSLPGDTTDWGYEVFTSKGFPAYSKLATINASVDTGGKLPRTFNASVNWDQLGYVNASLPAPGLYDLGIVPYSPATVITPQYLPVGWISATLNIRLDATACPALTGDGSGTYVRVR